MQKHDHSSGELLCFGGSTWKTALKDVSSDISVLRHCLCEKKPWCIKYKNKCNSYVLWYFLMQIKQRRCLGLQNTGRKELAFLNVLPSGDWVCCLEKSSAGWCWCKELQVMIMQIAARQAWWAAKTACFCSPCQAQQHHGTHPVPTTGTEDRVTSVTSSVDTGNKITFSPSVTADVTVC